MNISKEAPNTLSQEQNNLNTPDINLKEVKEKIKSSDKSIKLNGLCELRTLLSESNNSFEKDIDQDLILQLIQFLDKTEDYEIQVESSSIISQICSRSTNICQSLNQTEAPSQLIDVLDLENQVVLDNVLSILNSLLVEDPKTREIYLQKGCLKKVSSIFNKYPIPPIKKQILSFSRRIVQQKPYPQWKDIKSLAPVLQEVIQGITDGETLSQALECLAAILDASETGIQNIINLGFVPFLIQHVYNVNEDIFFYALRALGTIATGNDEQTNQILKHPNLLVRLFELIKHPDSKIQKEVCWIISNIAAGTESQIKQIVNGPNYMNDLKHALSQGGPDVSIEVSWVYANLSNHNASSKLINDLVNKYDFLECISIMLNKQNPKINYLALEALRNILREDKNLPIKKIADFIQNDLADKIRNIPYNDNDQTYIDEINARLLDLGFNSAELRLANEKDTDYQDKDCAEEND